MESESDLFTKYGCIIVTRCQDLFTGTINGNTDCYLQFCAPRLPQGAVSGRVSAAARVRPACADLSLGRLALVTPTCLLVATSIGEYWGCIDNPGTGTKYGWIYISPAGRRNPRTAPGRAVSTRLPPPRHRRAAPTKHAQGAAAAPISPQVLMIFSSVDAYLLTPSVCSSLGCACVGRVAGWGGAPSWHRRYQAGDDEGHQAHDAEAATIERTLGNDKKVQLPAGAIPPSSAPVGVRSDLADLNFHRCCRDCESSSAKSEVTKASALCSPNACPHSRRASSPPQ